MSIQKVVSQLRRAVEDYDMIQDGDKIAIGLSGGKDSITLASALKYYQRFSPQKYELVAVIIDLFEGKTDYSELIKYLESINLDYKIINSRIYDVVFTERKESNPCSLCAKLRRGILNTEAKKLGCNKIALGHTADDMDETFFLSLFYEGRISTFSPVSYLSLVDITLIRPLIYVEESATIAFAKDKPVVFNCCPADKNTKRQFIKELLADITDKIPHSKKRIHDALIHTERINLVAPIPRYKEAHDIEKQEKFEKRKANLQAREEKKKMNEQHSDNSDTSNNASTTNNTNGTTSENGENN